MILYFTGTGNSQWAAEEIAKLTNDVALNIKALDPLSVKLEDQDTLGIVFPIYAWNVPSPMQSFLKKINIPKSIYCFTICTCGENCGKAITCLEKCIHRSVNSAISLVMPNNYIQGGNCDSEMIAKEKIKNSYQNLIKLSNIINSKTNYTNLTKGFAPNICTKLISPLFNKFAMSDKKFSINNSCIGCKICQENCPVNNIELINGKPVFKGNCCQCTSCINRCPAEAIQYGILTKGRTRYFFKKEYKNFN